MAGIATDGGALFKDRADAGAQLGRRLAAYKSKGVLVMGIPRGGVPVAAEVARALDAELDVVVARKLGAPISSELAIGAVTADGCRYLNDAIVRELAVPITYVEEVTARQSAEAKRRETLFRGDRAADVVQARTVILVDDGLATGATMIAAARSIRARRPARLVIAVPVGSPEACEALKAEADDVVCLSIPENLWAIGLHYRDFRQTEDADVQHLLAESKTRHGGARESAPGRHTSPR
jgi:putative phosphoribosyl transferase